MNFSDLTDEIKIAIIIFISTRNGKYVYEKNIVELLKQMKVNNGKSIWDKYKDKLLDLGIAERIYKNNKKQFVYWISDECLSWIREIYINISEIKI